MAPQNGSPTLARFSCWCPNISVAVQHVLPLTQRLAVCSETLLETWLVMEYCDRGSLLDAVRAGRFYRKRDGEPDMVSIYRCLLDIATGACLPGRCAS
jgi:hypothetical protein